MPTLRKRKVLLSERPETVVLDGVEWVSVPKAAEFLDVHWTRVYALSRSKRIRHVTVDGRMFVSIPSLKAYRKEAAWWNDMHAPKTAKRATG